MPFGDEAEHYRYTRDDIVWRAPKTSGVYGIYVREQFIFIGETASIQESLEKHLNGDNSCISSHAPTDFVFETCRETIRAARRQELATELKPLCE
jgi:predicted GIY-YIG superfamily endonuclease